MPENFSLPSNVSNEDSGTTPEQSSGQVPEQQEPEQRFSPPPSNVFIRTSQSDLEKIKSEGGAISGMPPSSPSPPPVTPTPTPVPPMEQESSVQGAQAEPGIQPEPAFSESEPSFAPEAPVGISEFPTTEAEPPQKNKLLAFIIIGVLIVAVAALGYFYLWPKFFEAKPVVTTTTTTTTSTTTTTLAASPYPQISGPFQKSLFNIEISGSDVVKAIKDSATSEMAAPGTFKILIPKVHNDALTNEEIVLSLIPQLPTRLKPYMLARKYLVYSYYGAVNPSLGLIIDIGEESKEEVKSIFLAWERRLGILSDLKDFFLVSIPKKTANDFKETTNAGAEIRYFTYSGEEAAITYAFSDIYLIMSSSLESVNSAISHLQGITEPIYP
jgi:hypothetical protein